MECFRTGCENDFDDQILCNKCKLVKYCSLKCQNQDIEAHKRVCSSHMFALEEFERSQLDSSLLGRGSYGEVRTVVHKPTGLKYAMKAIPKEVVEERLSLKFLLREATVHKSISHSRIVQLYDFLEDEKNYYLVLEWIAGGNLFSYIRKRRGLPERTAWKFFSQTCTAIKHLHDNGFIHRDIKPENILLDGNNNLKLCDFGWSAQGGDYRNTFCGTLDYMAPEIIKLEDYSKEVDIWALGVLLCEMLQGRPPFRGNNDTQKARNIVKGCFTLGPQVPKEAQEFIKKLLKTDKKQRLVIDDIFREHWMQKFHKDGKKEPEHPQSARSASIDVSESALQEKMEELQQLTKKIQRQSFGGIQSNNRKKKGFLASLFGCSQR